MRILSQVVALWGKGGHQGNFVVKYDFQYICQYLWLLINLSFLQAAYWQCLIRERCSVSTCVIVEGTLE